MDNLIAQAKQLLQHQQREQARQLLMRAVRAAGGKVDGEVWWLLGQTVDDLNQQADCVARAKAAGYQPPPSAPRHANTPAAATGATVGLPAAVTGATVALPATPQPAAATGATVALPATPNSASAPAYTAATITLPATPPPDAVALPWEQPQPPAATGATVALPATPPPDAVALPWEQPQAPAAPPNNGVRPPKRAKAQRRAAETQQRSPYPQEQIDFVIAEFGRHEDRYEIVQKVIARYNGNYKDAEALIEYVQHSYSGSIARKQMPLILVLSIAGIIGGLYLVGTSVWYWQSAPLIYSLLSPRLIFRFGSGLAMLIGGIAGIVRNLMHITRS